MKTHNNIETNIAEIANTYENIKRCYHGWGEDFVFLKGKKLKNKLSKSIKELNIKKRGVLLKRIDKSDRLNIFSEDMNFITCDLIKHKCGDNFNKLKLYFNSCVKGKDPKKIRTFQYLLYFIHPGIHELYYFGSHFSEGYSNRLKKLLLYKRQGLKGLKTYINKPGNKINDSYPKGCGSGILKHLLIHPTTIQWFKPTNQNKIKPLLNKIDFNRSNLTNNEKEVAKVLCQDVELQFNRWFEYSPCAINSGPFFELKKRKTHTKCFKEVVECLKKDEYNSKKILTILKKHYKFIKY